MFRYLIFSLLLIVIMPWFSFGQSDSLSVYKQKFDQEFGLDVLLYSGQYYYPETNVVEGSPYWEKQPLLVGTVYMKGKAFENKQLRYHMNLREFILVFNDSNGAEKQIILDSNKVDSIVVQSTKFIPNRFTEINNKYLQVISEDKLPCFLSWQVEKNFITTGNNVGYHYLKSSFDTYVYYNHHLTKLKKEKDLVALFPDELKSKINDYWKAHRVKWKKIQPAQMQTLIRECEKYLE